MWHWNKNLCSTKERADCRSTEKKWDFLDFPVGLPNLGGRKSGTSWVWKLMEALLSGYWRRKLTWLYAKVKQSLKMYVVKHLFFFLIWVLRPFQEYFTYIEPIVHQRWAKNRRTRRKTTWPSVSRTWLSHIWPELGSNHSSEKPNGLTLLPTRLSILQSNR